MLLASLHYRENLGFYLVGVSEMIRFLEGIVFLLPKLHGEEEPFGKVSRIKSGNDSCAGGREMR